MRKWIKRIFLILAILLLASVPVIFFGGKWAVGKYLGREIAVGQGHLKLVDPRWRWSLGLAADSLYYHDPGIGVESGPVRISANLFRSFLRFSPSVDLAVDTLRLRLLPKPDTIAVKEPRKDSIAFPDLKIPASVKVTARQITVSDSAGFLAGAEEVALATGGPRSITLQAGRVRARQLDTLSLKLRAGLDWEGDTARATANVERGPDRVGLEALLPKANILLGEADLRVWVLSTRPFVAAFKASANLPAVDSLELTFRASQGRGYRLEADLKGLISGFDPKAAYRLGSQRVEFRLGFRDSAGQWFLASRGSRGEDVDLRGNIKATSTDSLADPAWLGRHLESSLKGRLRGIRIVAGGKSVTSDAEIAFPRLGADAARGGIVTGDGSRVQVDLKKGALGWGGTFSADIVPGERWVRAFADTAVGFRSLRVRGSAQQNKVEAITNISGLEAYGLLADSLRLTHRYGPQGYEIKPSYWHRKGVVWQLSGKVELAKAGKPMAFRIWHPDFGSLDFRMPRPGVMEARAAKLAIDKLPYKGLDTLASYRPRLTADFRWDRPAMTGRADILASGIYRQEKLTARVKAGWDRNTLDAPEAVVSLGGASLRAGARLRLGGKQFYELGKLDREDYRLVFLEADNFDLAKALRVALPDPPLLKGMLDGRLTYSDSAGFVGTYKLLEVQPKALAEVAVIRFLTLEGRGDSLVIRAVTSSKKKPLLNDSAYLALTGVLGEVQGLQVRVAANKSLFFDFDGHMRAFKDLEGRFGLQGGVALPGKSGELRNLRARAELAMVFKEGLPGLKLRMDTLGGQYAVPGFDTQSFSAPLRVQAGRFSIPDLKIKGKGGELHGKADYALTGARVMTASLQGSSLLAKLGPGDMVQLRDLVVSVRSDSTLLTLEASVGSGSAEHVKSPMRAAADFSRVAIRYRAPQGKPKPGIPSLRDMASLKVDAVLDNSNIKYRMRSFQTLQNLFKKSPDKRPVRKQAIRPMQVEINVETAGTGNHIETDILRLGFVGNFSMKGAYPYALVQGRINSTQGELGTKKQAYKVSRLEIKWLNSTLEEGQISLEAKKKLAKNCESGTTDSCTVTNILSGRLSEMQFAYRTDCGGADNAGADVTALVYSVRRGCYSSAFAGGGTGMSYSEQALALLEPFASDYLSKAAGRLSGNWIAETQITGLGALASDKKASGTGDTASATQAIALEIISKEFWRTRLRLRSYYRPQEIETDPWAYRMALEWRPPLSRYIENPKWKQRVKNRVTVDASLYTDTSGTLSNQAQQKMGRRLGLNYNYDFWGRWWAQDYLSRDSAVPGTPGAGLPISPKAAETPKVTPPPKSVVSPKTTGTPKTTASRPDTLQ